MLNELDRLEQMLEMVGAEYSRKTNFVGMDQIILYKNGEMIDDAIYGFGSHGFENGLLECYCLGDCEGNLTAEEVFDGWEQMLLKA